MKRIAVVGSGVSGLMSAYSLSARYEVTLFEKNSYLGGHTHTVSVELDGKNYSIDTGFIVFNKKTYPNFCKLLETLKIPIQLSEMSFSYRSKINDMEYNGHTLNTLFSDRRNLYRPRFYRFISEIVRFNRDAKAFLLNSMDHDISIQQFLTKNNYHEPFINHYFIPMMSSIWSKQKEDSFNSSAHFIFSFYQNHGLLDVYNRPPWYVIAQGSSRYIAPMIKGFENRVFLNSRIDSVVRQNNKILLTTNGSKLIFDAVVMATHSDQALKLLEHPTEKEISVLSAIKYTNNEVLLHTDERVMPKRKLSWASWNYLDNGSSTPTLTYYMNRLQTIQSPYQFLVSLNLGSEIDEGKILKRINYSHPCLNQVALKAQLEINAINGKNNTFYAGSYWGAGFHEDGVNSALKTCSIIEQTYV